MKTPGSKNKSNLKYYIAIAFLGAVFVIGGFVSFSPYSPLYQWWVPGTPAEPDADVSTFIIKDFSTNLLVSNSTKCSLYLPLSTEDPSLWDEDEFLDLDLYNETIVEEYAEDIEIDLTDEIVFFFEIASDDAHVYANGFILCGAGGNSIYTFFAYNQSEVVLFNIADDTLDEIDVSVHQTNGTYLILYTVPEPDATVQAPLYSPIVDTLKDWDVDDPLTSGTDFFGFQFVFNDTISTVITNVTHHVNFTISEDVSALVVYDDDSIYIIFYEIEAFSEMPSGLYYTIEYGFEIALDDVDAVRLEIPEGIEGTFTPTKISDIV